LLYILSGQDDYSIAQALEQIKSGLGDRESLEINTTTLEGQQVTLEQLATACETVPFMTDKRLVIISGLVARFEPKGGARRKNGKRNAKSDDVQPFVNRILNMPQTTVLVLIEEAVSGTNPLYKEIAPKAAVKTFPMLKDSALTGWVRKRVSELGGTISPGAANLLARLVGSNLWTMSGEVDKLVLYASGRKIEEEDVNKLVGYTQQYSVFNMVDAILEFKAERAGQLLRQQLQSGAAPVYLLTMIARQARMIVLAKEMSRQRLPRAEIQVRLGATSEFVVRKTLEQATRYSLPRLKEIYKKLLDTDLSIKTGRYDQELALYVLVAELCRRENSPPVRQGAG
jgi:DNA polymerase-3 subunit delta